ncbi:MAG TPA: CopG family transcriptional regulator [Candidatus Dormibacteraeota bacterium]|nr:CopG family transcriptional regulator [Candidatus Dormibacteraeota bacterium]
MEQKEHFSLRLHPSTVRRLVAQARHRGLPKTRVAEQYLEEAVRMADHPGIGFRDGAGGRRAALAGHRLDVWQVVETVGQEGGDLEAAAEYLGISPGLVGAAVGYYADYREEVDAWIERNSAMARDAEEAWRRRQSAFQR